nr:PilZ domain-containing protein [uncultured Pseudomonas sp.]
MQDQPLLTSSELEFLRQLQQQPGGPESAPTANLQVEAGPQFEALLAGCAAKEKLTIEAHFANQRLTFTPELVADASHEHHLRLGTPQIFDEGETLRAWRSRLPTPLALQQPNTEPSDIWLHQLSMSGLLVEQRANAATAPQRLRLTLPLAGQPPITINGSFVRKTEQGLLAYRLAPLDEHSEARLQQFIYQQHRAHYPQAHM